MKSLFFFLPAAAGGLIQGMTGFGSGIILVIFYPWILGVVHAAAMNQSLAVLICSLNVIRYHKYIQRREVIFPVLMYIPIYIAALAASGKMDASSLKSVLGIFLIILSIYFLCFSSRIHIEANYRSLLVCVTISAFSDAFFGLGGPAMAIYFLAAVKEKKSYLGTIQCFLLLTNIWGVFARIFNGDLPLSLFPHWIAAAAGILCGLFFAGKLVEKTDIEQIKRYTYLMIGAAGLVTLVSSFFV